MHFSSADITIIALLLNKAKYKQFQELYVQGLSQEDILSLLLPSKDNLYKAEEIVNSFLNHNTHSLITIFSSMYPEQLKEIPNPPLALFAVGDVLLLQQLQISIVGSRKATRSGLAIAESFADELAQNGIVITSGFAIGIDSAAHRGALPDGKTIAVLGCGVNINYPVRNQHLRQEIIEKGGLIVTEFFPNENPLPQNFLQRNRIIAGLSKAVVVIQASRRSGALSTARYALDFGRDVCAVPGAITDNFHSGCNYLIQQGAYLVTKSQDILEVCGIDAVKEEKQHTNASQINITLNKEEEMTLNLLKREGALSVSELCCALNLSIAQVNKTVANLELNDLVVIDSGSIVKPT